MHLLSLYGFLHECKEPIRGERCKTIVYVLDYRFSSFLSRSFDPISRGFQPVAG